MRICGRAGSLDAALTAWADARELGVTPDLILYSAMIDACAKVGLGAAVVGDLQDSSPWPRRQAAAHAARPAAHRTESAPPLPQCGDAAAAMHTFTEMRRQGVQPDVVAYTSLLAALQGTPKVGRRAGTHVWCGGQAG